MVGRFGPYWPSASLRCAGPLGLSGCCRYFLQGAFGLVESQQTSSPGLCLVPRGWSAPFGRVHSNRIQPSGPPVARSGRTFSVVLLWQSCRGPPDWPGGDGAATCGDSPGLRTPTLCLGGGFPRPKPGYRVKAPGPPRGEIPLLAHVWPHGSLVPPSLPPFPPYPSFHVLIPFPLPSLPPYLRLLSTAIPLPPRFLFASSARPV